MLPTFRPIIVQNCTFNKWRQKITKVKLEKVSQWSMATTVVSKISPNHGLSLDVGLSLSHLYVVSVISRSNAKDSV